ncbi:MAG: glutamate-5-semialdehyde dehydrogenase [Clostridia bacterium]|nr:glutamate-5-semialdehyde dehydrogenase [Clostridia bacterium]
MQNIKQQLEKQCASLKTAAAVLNVATTEDKNKALLRMADVLEAEIEYILAANKLDTDAFEGSASMLDRLTLTADRICGIADGIRQVASLPDPVGEIMESFKGADGLLIDKVRVPMGVIGIIYEARPNVTADCACLCLKTGNAVLLRGSATAINSNKAMVKVIKSALEGTAIPADAVELLEDTSREASNIMMSSRGLIDVLIPRGGGNLIRAVADNAKVPVLETGVGNCHVYVHKSADPEMAKRLVINAKTDRPSVCNSAETLLIDKDYPDTVGLLTALFDAGVTLHGCEDTVKLFPKAVPAKFPEDYEAEHLSLDMAVKIVGCVNCAVKHIARFGSGHTELIIAEDKAVAEDFQNRVDAACVNHNASTRYTDGGMFGFGAEIGISTQKLHARGPMGLRELTSYKYKVHGNGQIRTKSSGGDATTLAVIGSGFMARSFVSGLISTKTLAAENITVVNPMDAEGRDKMAADFGCVAGDVADISGKDVVLYAIKPQNFTDDPEMYKPYVTENTCVMSIMAGVSTDALSEALGGRRVVRFMPNMALSQLESATAFALGKTATDDDRKMAQKLFAPLGIVVEVVESQMSDVTALSGSGPAYFCRLCEVMAKAAEAEGFDPADAEKLAVQTFVGTVKLLDELKISPAELRARITSKGGTTYAALCSMDETDFDGSVAAAMAAAKRRSDELGK